MKKYKFLQLITVIAAVVLLVCNTVTPIFAASTPDAKDIIDTSRKSSLKLTYQSGEKKYEGLEINLYRVASVTSDYQYQLTGDFSEYSVKINGLKSNSEWKTVAETFGAYITADNIEATASAVTDSNGVVSFADLEIGLYYICWTGNPAAGNIKGFDPFMLSLPTLNEDGTWNYDIDAYPKAGGNIEEPTDEYLRVIKQWRDLSDKKRPVSVNVEIYCDGELLEVVELNANNDWTYTWKSNGDHDWSVVEREVPDTYTVSVERNGQNFIVTNTSTDSPPPPPKTGDNSQMELYVLIAAISGVLMIFVGVLLGRRKNA